jgi:hypothetical protein
MMVTAYVSLIPSPVTLRMDVHQVMNVMRGSVCKPVQGVVIVLMDLNVSLLISSLIME